MVKTSTIGPRFGTHPRATSVGSGWVARASVTMFPNGDVAFEVIQRIWRKHGVGTLIMRVARLAAVVALITKEHFDRLGRGRPADLPHFLR